MRIIINNFFTKNNKKHTCIKHTHTQNNLIALEMACKQNSLFVPQVKGTVKKLEKAIAV